MLREREYAILNPGDTEWEWRKGMVDYNVISKTVGGYIERICIDTPCVVYCNEEGLIHGLPRTAVWVHAGRVHNNLVGTLIAFGPANEDADEEDPDGSETSLTKEVLDKIKDFIKPSYVSAQETTCPICETNQPRDFNGLCRWCGFEFNWQP